MNIDDLVTLIENFLSEYDPYGFNDTYNSWTPTAESFEDIKSRILSDTEYYIRWFSDVAEDDTNTRIKEEARMICNALKNLDTFQDISDVDACSITGDTDIFGEDPDFFFTRDDIMEYIEEPLQDQIPEIESCRGYIDKDETGKYVLSVDIITDDYELTGVAAPAVTIDMRKIKKPSDLGKYLTPIIQIYNDTLFSFNEYGEQMPDPYFDDPTQYGSLDNPITPWGGSIN